jgi:hypothetical protein
VDIVQKRVGLVCLYIAQCFKSFHFKEMLSQFSNIQNNLMQIIEAFLESYGMLITYKSIYIPALLIYSFGVMVSFACISFLYPISITALAEHFVLTLYTAITRRIHLPKHRTPNKFTPSISFMGGWYLLCACSVCETSNCLSHQVDICGCLQSALDTISMRTST